MAWTRSGLFGTMRFHTSSETAMLNTFGLDLAKRVFQLPTVDLDTGEIRRIELRRRRWSRTSQTMLPVS